MTSKGKVLASAVQAAVAAHNHLVVKRTTPGGIKEEEVLLGKEANTTTNEDEDNYAITPTHRECMQYLDKIRLYVESHSTDNTFLYTFEQHMQNLAPKNKQTNILNIN